MKWKQLSDSLITVWCCNIVAKHIDIHEVEIDFNREKKTHREKENENSQRFTPSAVTSWIVLMLSHDLELSVDANYSLTRGEHNDDEWAKEGGGGDGKMWNENVFFSFSRQFIKLPDQRGMKRAELYGSELFTFYLQFSKHWTLLLCSAGASIQWLKSRAPWAARGHMRRKSA